MINTRSSAFPPRPLRALAGHALEAALNRATALDPATREALGKLEGRRVYLHLRGPELTMEVCIEDGRWRVQAPDAGGDEESSLRVSATPGSLLAMAVPHGHDGAIPPGKVDIAGDADLARRLERLVRNYAPDFEAAFARSFGDVLGVPLARVVRKALSHLRDSGSHFAQDSADWLREESRLTVAAPEMDDFLDAVDELRERSERLRSRVDRLADREPGA